MAIASAAPLPRRRRTCRRHRRRRPSARCCGKASRAALSCSTWCAASRLPTRRASSSSYLIMADLTAADLRHHPEFAGGLVGALLSDPTKRLTRRLRRPSSTSADGARAQPRARAAPAAAHRPMAGAARDTGPGVADTVDAILASRGVDSSIVAKMPGASGASSGGAAKAAPRAPRPTASCRCSSSRRARARRRPVDPARARCADRERLEALRVEVARATRSDDGSFAGEADALADAPTPPVGVSGRVGVDRGSAT